MHHVKVAMFCWYLSDYGIAIFIICVSKYKEISDFGSINNFALSFKVLSVTYLPWKCIKCFFFLIYSNLKQLFQMTLQMLSSDQSEDLRGVKTYLNNFLPFSSEQVCVFSDHGQINVVFLWSVLLILNVYILFGRFIQEMKLLKKTLSSSLKDSWRTQKRESTSSRCVCLIPHRQFWREKNQGCLFVKWCMRSYTPCLWLRLST